MNNDEDKPEQGEPKRRVEYFIPSSVPMDRVTGGISKAWLNKFGEDGWRLVCVHQGQFIFMREE